MYFVFRLFLMLSYNLTWVTVSEFHGTLNSSKHFTRLINLPSVHLKRTWEVAWNKQGICTCVVPKFHPGLDKKSIIWKIWNFHPWLEFHLGLAKPSWNFNLVCRAEISTYNCNVILKRSLLLAEMKF